MQGKTTNQNAVDSILSLIGILRNKPLTAQGCYDAVCIIDKIENEIKAIDSNLFSAPQEGDIGEHKYGCIAVKTTDYRAVIKSDSIITITEAKVANGLITSILLNSGNWLEVDAPYEVVISAWFGHLRNVRGDKIPR